MRWKPTAWRLGTAPPEQAPGRQSRTADIEQGHCFNVLACQAAELQAGDVWRKPQGTGRGRFDSCLPRTVLNPPKRSSVGQEDRAAAHGSPALRGQRCGPPGSDPPAATPGTSGAGAETCAGRDHWRRSSVDRVDDLGAVDALQVDQGDPEIRVCKLALDDHQRNALVRHLDIGLCGGEEEVRELALLWEYICVKTRRCDGRPMNGTGGEATEVESARERARQRLMRSATGGLTLGEYAERVRTLEQAGTDDQIDVAIRGLPEEIAGPPAHRMPRWIIAVFGGTAQRGRWRLGKRVFVVTAFGGATLDLSAAQAEAPESTINVVTILGGADIIAPPGIAVELSGLALLAGKADKRAPGPPLPGSPVVRVRAFTFLGGVAIKEPQPSAAGSAN